MRAVAPRSRNDSGRGHHHDEGVRASLDAGRATARLGTIGRCDRALDGPHRHVVYRRVLSDAIAVLKSARVRSHRGRIGGAQKVRPAVCTPARSDSLSHRTLSILALLAPPFTTRGVHQCRDKPTTGARRLPPCPSRAGLHWRPRFYGIESLLRRWRSACATSRASWPERVYPVRRFSPRFMRSWPSSTFRLSRGMDTTRAWTPWSCGASISQRSQLTEEKIIDSERPMTYRIHVPGAVDGDVVTADVHGSALSVVRNGRELSPDEYQLSCDHERETAGCPACVQRSGGFAFRKRVENLARGVNMRPPRGSWGILDPHGPKRATRPSAILPVKKRLR